jgi:hypothetical protein
MTGAHDYHVIELGRDHFPHDGAVFADDSAGADARAR